MGLARTLCQIKYFFLLPKYVSKEILVYNLGSIPEIQEEASIKDILFLVRWVGFQKSDIAMGHSHST